MTTIDKEAYQHEIGDISIQEVRRGRYQRFKVYVYRNQCWEQFGSEERTTFSPLDVQELTLSPWHFVGEGEWKGKKRCYYRHAEYDEGRIPQFPH